jgi:hypothetical protein
VPLVEEVALATVTRPRPGFPQPLTDGGVIVGACWFDEHMFEKPIVSLDPSAVLAVTERRTRARRAGAVKDIRLVLQWCDLHSSDPQAEPDAVPVRYGGDRLVQVGGDGTPRVAQLCFAELAIARQAGVVATEHHAADCLDLRHRLPLLWTAVRRLQVEPWAALRVARMSRKLSKDKVALVDAAVTAAVHQAPGRLLDIAEAKIIEADPALHREKLTADARRTGVRVSKPKPGEIVDDLTGEPATRRITAKVPHGVAVRCEENIDDLAHALLDHTEPDQDPDGNGDAMTLDQARVLAFEMLTTDPHTAAAFLDGLHDQPAPVDEPNPNPEPEPEPAPEPAPVPPRRRRKRRPAQITVHLAGGTLCGCTDGIARVEDYGPVLISELRDLLGPDRDITVQPVIDLNTVRAVNGYEHPTAMRRRTIYRTGGDVFPHSTSRGLQRLDLDHPTRYDPHGPPGQTSDRNAAPLLRRHHRAKTHHNYQLTQLALGAYRWITPHGLCRVVTPHGTRVAEPIRAPDGTITGEIYYDTPTIQIDHNPRE